MTKRYVPLAMAILLLASAAGCATVSRDQFYALQSVVASNQSKLQDIDKKLDDMSGNLEASRRPQAEVVADVGALRQEIMKLRGEMDETRHVLSDSPGKEEMDRQLDEKLAGFSRRLAKVESYLGIKPPATEPQAGPQVSPAVKTPDKPAKPQSPQELYDLGIRLYRQQSYDAARDRLQEVIKLYPDSEWAPSAQFWVGETYFSQKRFEEAILAYNQVIKRYPKSRKVPAALLKQGLAFKSLGDKRTAKIVLNKLVKEYPKSHQAKLAKSYLAKLK